MTASRRITPVILSGGIGARLWPASRRLQPKQLLPLVDDRSMLRATIDRVASLGSVTPPIIVTSGLHADAIEHELASASQSEATLILEPMGRNTAPAIAVAALEALTMGGEPLLLVLPSDHTIADEKAFADAVLSAAEAAASRHLVTFGITPERPETGYGYIKLGPSITGNVMRVDEFREKPDAITAATYVESGEYLWNSGMFLLQASTYLEELETHDPTMADLARKAWKHAEREGQRVQLNAEAFSKIDGSSIDYAVMERTALAAVVPTDPGWNDVGSWASLWDIAGHDAEGNVVSGDVLAVDVHDSFVRGGDRLIAVVGLEDIVVVDTPDAVLVTSRERAQDVKQIVDLLASENRAELETDGTLLKPWGGFRTVTTGPGYRVLHLWLDPGEKTSIQVHERKSEHWQVLRGVANVTIGDSTTVVPERESVYIPPGAAHRLENKGDSVLEVIELDVDMQMDEASIAQFLGNRGAAEEAR
jgi:mannose-1-phosphate guanylyltransferase/mannose-6-phosphate isomerase